MIKVHKMMANLCAIKDEVVFKTKNGRKYFLPKCAESCIVDGICDEIFVINLETRELESLDEDIEVEILPTKLHFILK